MWRNVDPTTDHFRVFLNGFSSAYRLGKGPDGDVLTLRRTIELEYDRRGDEFDEFEKEIELKSEPRWVYRPDSSETSSDTVAARD